MELFGGIFEIHCWDILGIGNEFLEARLGFLN